jgi:hypothetical protein
MPFGDFPIERKRFTKHGGAALPSQSRWGKRGGVPSVCERLRKQSSADSWCYCICSLIDFGAADATTGGKGLLYLRCHKI